MLGPGRDLRNACCSAVLGLLVTTGCAWPLTAATAGVDLRAEINVGDRSCRCLVHRPPACLADQPLPLVVVLHGVDMDSAAKQTGFSA